MAQSYIVFDFGANEESAQQARHRLDGWRQAFHLTKKLEYKFERKPGEKKDDSDRIRVLVRLDFSDHERLSHQRWIERIPGESPFKDASPRVLKAGETGFASAAELFDSLN